MSDLALTTGDADPVAEVGSLARALARGYQELVESYRTHMGLTPQEAEARVRDLDAASWQDSYVNDPPDQIQWWGLSSVVAHDPAAGYAIWARIRDEARQELTSGHRAAQVVEGPGQSPWDRARFLALREAFVTDWQPQGGVESALVEILAISFAEYLRWTERLTIDAETEGRLEDFKLKVEGSWQPARISVAAAIEEAARLADQAYRRFRLTIRQLQELRRLPTLQGARAGQVTFGGCHLTLMLPASADGSDR